jgi:hypothetical protein
VGRYSGEGSCELLGCVIVGSYFSEGSCVLKGWFIEVSERVVWSCGPLG